MILKVGDRILHILDMTYFGMENSIPYCLRIAETELDSNSKILYKMSKATLRMTYVYQLNQDDYIVGNFKLISRKFQCDTHL